MQRVEMTVNVRKKNGTQYYQKVETEVEDNKLRSLGVVNGSNNLKAVNTLFGHMFIDEQIVSYHSYKQSPKK